MSVIPRHPSKAPARSPLDEQYFDERDLEGELRRAFQICHECRMCVGYCGSFPEMFSRIDRAIERGAEGAETMCNHDFAEVGDACWQCKLCYIKCPYTPDEGAAEMLDFPRLMARERAVRARRDGIPLVDKILAEPHIVGEMAAGPQAAAGNLIMANRLARKAQEVATGISAEFPLPPFATERFSTWFRKRPQPAASNTTVALFSTCYGEFNVPHVVRAAVQVLEHNGISVALPEPKGPLTGMCCGMPTLDGGDVQGFVEKVKRGTEALLPFAEQGIPIIVVGPTCGLTIKKEWHEYVDSAEVKKVSESTLDLMQFLDQLRKEKRLRTDGLQKLGTIAYHAACHLRAQKIGFPGARVLGLAPETDVRVIEECSAVDGTWGMKARHYEAGRKYAQRLVRGVADLEPNFVVSDCTLAGLRVQKENGLRVMHPVEALAQAYGISTAS